MAGCSVLFVSARLFLSPQKCVTPICDVITRGPSRSTQPTGDRKSDAMHAVAVSYAGRYNARTGHIGHVFQERFWDSPIKSEVYLLEAIRYIHLNPQKQDWRHTTNIPGAAIASIS